jgi:hypothetical protein
MCAMDASARRWVPRLAGAAAALVALVILVVVARREPPAPPAARPSAPVTTAPTAAPTTAAPTTVTPGPTPVPLAPTPPPELLALVAEGAAPQIPVLQDGVPMQAYALAPDGTLVAGAGFDFDPYRASPRVGAVSPGANTVRWLPADRDAISYAAGDGLIAWTAHLNDEHDFDVQCGRAADDWKPVRVSATGARVPAAPQASGKVVAWTDEQGVAWTSEDCGAARRAGEGEVVALSGTDLFLRAGAEGGQVNRVNLTTGRALPMPIAFDGPAIFAASETYVVWVHNGRLNVYDRATAAVRRIEDDLPSGAGVNGAIGTLTVGRHLAAYASRPMDGDPALARAFVVDLTGIAGVRLSTEAFVAGDRIAWREGDHYTVAGTR